MEKFKKIIWIIALMVLIVLIGVIVYGYYKNATMEVKRPVATMEVENFGTVKMELYPEYAPETVANFITLANRGFYDGLTFHRIIKDFMIQGGDPLGNGTGGESIWAGKDTTIDAGNGFKDEFSAFLYNIRGSLSMANAGTGTNGSQFFINQNTTDMSSQLSSSSYPGKIVDAYKNGGNPNLDSKHTVFGQVIDGMDVVDKIASVETDDNDKPKTDVKIESIEIIKDYTN